MSSVSLPVSRGLSLRALASESGPLLALALPLIFAQAAQIGMVSVDAIFAGRLSPGDLAGISLAGAVFWPLLLLIWGILMTVTPSVAQLRGRGKLGESGELVRQALWVTIPLAFVLIWMLRSSEPIYHWLQADPAAIKVAMGYLTYLSWGLPGLMCVIAMRAMVDGLGNVKPGMTIAFLALLLKMPLSYGLVFGVWGLPQLGGIGCGLAGAIAMWFEAAAFLVYLGFRRDYRMRTGVFERFSLPDWQHIRRLLALGIPMGLNIFMTVAVFSLGSLLLGRFGSEVLAAHEIALNFSDIMFMIPFSLGLAATIRVGYLVGAGDFRRAHLSGLATIIISALYAAGCLVFIFLARTEVAVLYTGGNSREVVALAGNLLLFVAFFQLFDAVQAALFGILLGYKDTKSMLYISIFGYWALALPLGVALGYGWFTEEMGAYGFWSGFVLGLFVVALGGLLRFYWLSANERRIRELANG